ncbi:MAG: ydaF [Eubacterium sp.]|nr:ydaF [Eubacterium sp.]
MFYIQVNDDIELRTLENKNAKELYKLIDDNRLNLREWLPWVGGTTSVEIIKRFIKSSKKQQADNNGFQAGIFYKGKIAGIVGLHGIDWSNKKTSLGYWLAKEYQGNGIMTQCCSAIINHVINELCLNRVEIRAAEFNKKSRAVPERLGFVSEGISRQVEWLYDRYVDHVIYAILAGEWEKIKNQKREE